MAKSAEYRRKAAEIGTFRSKSRYRKNDFCRKLFARQSILEKREIALKPLQKAAKAAFLDCNLLQIGGFCEIIDYQE